MLAVGCDPLSEEKAGAKASFLIACATAPNATTEKADIVFPLSTWVESHGAFVSTDGTLQLSRQAILPVGESQPAWAIASALVKAVRGGDAPYKTTRQLFAEIGRINPAFQGYSYQDFEAVGEVHWSYPQQAALGMPRPDLSAIPVPQPDIPMWMPVANTGSRVERAARLTRGDQPPSVPGQDDPRRIAALLGLAYDHARHPNAPSEAAADGATSTKTGYVPLRVMATSSAQPAGPTPAKRHQKLGVAPHLTEAIPVPMLAQISQEEPSTEASSETATSAPAAQETPPAQEAKEESTSTESAESSEVQGDSNVATVDEVTEDKDVPLSSTAEETDSGSAEEESNSAKDDSSEPNVSSKTEETSVPGKAKKGKRKGAKEKKKS